MSVPLPLLSQSHFRHALLRAGVGHSTPAYKRLFIFAWRIGILGDFAQKRQDMEVQKTYEIPCRRNSVDTLLVTKSLYKRKSLHRGDTYLGFNSPLPPASITMSIVTKDVTCSLSSTQSFLISAGRFLCAKIFSPSRRVLKTGQAIHF